MPPPWRGVVPDPDDRERAPLQDGDEDAVAVVGIHDRLAVDPDARGRVLGERHERHADRRVVRDARRPSACRARPPAVRRRT